MKNFTLLVICLMLMSGLMAQRARVKVPADLQNKAVKMMKAVDSPNLPLKPVNITVSSPTEGIESDLGTTYYDLQSNSSSPSNRVYVHPDGTKAGVWTTSQQTASWTDRGTGYNYDGGSGWGAAPMNRIETVKTGWPSYAPLGANGECVVSHQGGTAGLVFLTRTAKGTGAWTQTILSLPAGATGLLWPRMMTSGTNNNTVHIIALTAPVANGGTVYQGQDGAIVYNRSTNGGLTWEGWSIPTGLGSSYYLAFGGDNYSFCIGNGSNLAFTVCDNGSDLLVYTSSNNGASWTKHVAWEHPYPFFSSTMITPRFICPDGSAHGVVDNTGVCHLAFGINAAISDGTAISWYPWQDGVGYWNTTMPAMDTTTINPDTLFNHDKLIGWMQDVNGDGELTLVSSGGGYSLYYLSPTSMPQMIYDIANGILYAVFVSVTETFNNGVQDYRHIWTRASYDNGQTWDVFMDLTGSIFHIFDECVFPSISPTLDNGYPAILYQRDSEPGMCVRGDLDPATVNTLSYMIIDDYGTLNVINPSSFLATPISSSQIDLSWALNASDNNVIVAWSPTSIFGTPVPGTFYPTGSSIPGGGTILYTGNGTLYNHTGLTANTTYYYKAFSYNPSFTYSSGITNNATTLGATLSVTPLNQNVTATAGNTSFAITCNSTWSAVSNQTWCTVTPSGSGNGTLAVSYLANTSTSQRIATITITASGASPVNVTVTQAGAAPSLSVTPSNQNVGAAAGTTSFTVTSNTSWTCVSNATWCLVTTSGSGNGSIIANYGENITTSQRIATITVTASGAPPVTITVTQAGATPTLSVSPLNQNVGSAAGTTIFSVTSNSNWTALSDQTWCTVTPSGSGNGSLMANYTENTSTNQRVATITVSTPGVSPVYVTVTQSGVGGLYLNVTPPNQNVGTPAGSTSFNVSSNISWSAISNQSWCTVTPSGTGNATIVAIYTENISTDSRTAQITVSGSGVNAAIVTVTQEGAIPYLLVEPISQTVGPAAGTTFFNISSNTSWVAWSLSDWCTTTPSGFGSSLLQANYQANTTADERIASILVVVTGLTPIVAEVKQQALAIGIKEIENNFSLYPNPGTGKFVLALKDGSPFSCKTLIYNSTGELVRETVHSGQNSYDFDISNQQAGIYFMKIIDGSNVITRKIILNR